MSDDLRAAQVALQEKLDSAGFDGTVKFDIEDEGVLRIADGTVSTEDGDADCTISATMDTLRDLFSGDLDPTAAYMSGKIRIDGDMGAALKLGALLG